MSYQAITDIIVNPNQLQDLQLSSTVKDSPKQPSASFADFLASYKSEDDKEVSKSTDVKEPEKTEKSEKSEKTAENQVKNDKEPEKTADNTVEKTVSEDKTDKKVKEKTDSKVKLVKNPESEIKNPEENKKTAKTDVKEVKDSKNKKLSEKDFSRIDELTTNNSVEENSEKLAALIQTSVKSDENNDLQFKNDNSENQELTINVESGSQFAVNNFQTENNASDNDFDFTQTQNQNNDKKQFALDKEGKITVEDLRTEKVEEIADSKKSAIKTSDIKLTNENTAVISVDLNPNAEADVLSLNTQTAAADGSNFQAMLSNQLQNVAPEFVKAGNLVLKDNNQGTIDLILHPDDLGNVKIHLSLDGKTLSGHITVATKEALQVFKDNSETLREAFIKNGFDAANFDVAMNNSGSFNQNMGFENQNDGTDLIAKKMYGNLADGGSAEYDDIFDNAEDISNYSVNIVA